jgi:hypothetical protein
MSTRLSPDGMYYWDGQQWLSTLSHDGRSRWNGSAWVPTGQAAPPAGYLPARGVARQPTSWTRPLQYAVAGWYGVQAVYAATLPFWLSGPMTQAMTQSIQRQQQRQPTVSPPPAEFVSMMGSMMTSTLWFSAAIGIAISVVVIIGALQRWTWLYYVVLVLLGFSTISLPLEAVSVFAGPALSAVQGFSMPSWMYWLGFLLSIPAAALFVWMLIALIRRGPWAMTRVAPQLS